MLKYRLAATALKAFSFNSTTRSAYRQIGNVVGGRRRSKGVRPGYIEKSDANLRFVEDQHAIADGMRLLELGTGWVHWESLITRLFYDVEIVLFDIWDNRQFDGFQFYAANLKEKLPSAVNRSPEALARADALLDRVVASRSFEEAYDVLGFTYLIDPEGKLEALSENSIDLVISSDVMEHIPASTLPRLVQEERRVVRNGGHVSQMIVQADHLTIYDRTVHAKNYLRYTDEQWKRWFENDVQYTNRWQHSDFVKLFREEGFEIISEEIVSSADTSTIEVASRWKDYARADLDAGVTRLLARNSKG